MRKMRRRGIRRTERKPVQHGSEALGGRARRPKGRYNGRGAVQVKKHETSYVVVMHAHLRLQAERRATRQANAVLNRERIRHRAAMHSALTLRRVLCTGLSVRAPRPVTVGGRARAKGTREGTPPACGPHAYPRETEGARKRATRRGRETGRKRRKGRSTGTQVAQADADTD
ncbi:unnamed protein product, partial [Prorocentrum cordatum]